MRNQYCLTCHFVTDTACCYWIVTELQLILKSEELIQVFSDRFYCFNVTQVSGGENNTSS